MTIFTIRSFSVAAAAALTAAVTVPVIAQDSFGQAQQQQGFPPQQQQQGQGFPQQGQGFPQQGQGFPQQGQGFPQQQQGQGFPQQPGQGFPQQPGQGFPQQPGQGFPQQPGQGIPQQPGQGFPQQPGQGFPQQPGQGFPQQPGGFGQQPGGFGQPGGAGGGLEQLSQMERQDYGVPPTAQLHSGAMHGPTPNSIPGGQVITTQGLVELMRGGQVPVLTLDVLGGPEIIQGAQNAVPASQPGSFNDQTQQGFGQYLQQATGGNKQYPIVLYCLSTQCWMSYNASLRAINLGYTNVLWYRGGIEAWKQAGQPVQGAQNRQQ